MEGEAALRGVRVDGQRMPAHVIGPGAGGFKSDAHSIAADLRLARIDTGAVGTCHLHAAERRLQVLRERQRNLVWGGRHRTSDQRVRMVEEGVGLRGRGYQGYEYRSCNRDRRSHDPSPLEVELSRRGASAAEERLSDCAREHIVEIKMQLSNDADAGPTLSIDRDNCLETHLKISADPDHTRVDCASRDGAVAEIVGDRGLEIRLDDRNQMIDEIGQLIIVNFRFQIGHAVLD